MEHGLQPPRGMTGGASDHGTGAGMMAEARRALIARRDVLKAQPGTEAVRAELKDLEDALGRIDAGVWGRCEQCGGAIGRDRLRAVPDARCCVSCGR